MFRWMSLALALVLPLSSSAGAASTSTFEDVGLPANSFSNNAGSGGFFASGGNSFNNTFSPDFGGIWSGWAISSKTDTTTPGFTNQYSAITGSGAGGSATYAVGFTFGLTADRLHPSDSFVNLAAGMAPRSIQVTNTTYDYFTMHDGNAFSRVFGPDDFLRLTITGYALPG